MKLYPLLFINEGQSIFASSIYPDGYALVRMMYDGKVTLVLVNKNLLKENDNWKETGVGLVKGYISFEPTLLGPDLGSVRSSSAISGWGPILYQAAMKVVSPKWLTSDFSLSDDSSRIWNKMYELSDIYERRYIGHSREGTDAHECATNNLKSIPSKEDVATEEALLKFLKDTDTDPKDVGCFWAYRMRSFEPEIDFMLKDGTKILKAAGKQRILDWVNTAALP